MDRWPGKIESRDGQIVYLRCMMTFSGHPVVFSQVLPENKGFINHGTFYLPEHMVYKFIFMAGVDDTTVKVAIDHAINKIYNYINRL